MMKALMPVLMMKKMVVIMDMGMIIMTIIMTMMTTIDIITIDKLKKRL